MRITVALLALLVIAGPFTQALGTEPMLEAPLATLDSAAVAPPAPSATASPAEAAGRSAIITPVAVRDVTGYDLRPVAHDHTSHDHGAIKATFAPAPTAAGPGGTADMQFVCPTGPEIAGIPLPASSGDDPVVMGCPLRVYDTGWSFGNTHLVVNPDDHREAAFFSLHGAAVSDGPSERTRGGLAHTTFTTDQQGLEWQDQPLDFPDGNGFGEYASGAMDVDGNVYAAFLWNLPQGLDDFEPVIGLYKGPATTERGGMSDAYDYGRYLLARDPLNTIREAHLIRLPSHAPVLEEDAAANETAAPSGDDGVGNVAYDVANATEERVVAVWHETARDWSNATTGLSGWVDVAWTHTGAQNNWTRINRTEVIGPCASASDPAYFEDKIYVACTVERGYADRNRARVGDVDLWSIDVYTGTTELVDFTGIRGGGHPMLSVNEDGLMVLLLQRDIIDEDGVFQGIEADTWFGWYGRGWEPMADIGRPLRQLSGASEYQLLDADITALELTTDDQTAFIIYKEWYDEPQDFEIPPFDPDQGTQFISDRLTDYNKYIFSFNSCNFPLAGAHMELGTGVDTNNAESYQENPGMFNDVQDGMDTVRETNGQELTYFAINDYGAVQYGAIQVLSASNLCLNPAPPIAAPIPPVPQALTLANPFSMAAGAVLAAPAAAMVLYLLTVKKRVAHFVAAEDD